VGWGDPGQLIVVVNGSTSCPDVAKSATRNASQTVVVVVGMVVTTPSCTADFNEAKGNTIEIALPARSP
jgi:hypothetical protein